MIIKCEACQTAFKIKDELIKPRGSKVRCASCKHVFTVKPEESGGAASESIGKSKTRPQVSSGGAPPVSEATGRTIEPEPMPEAESPSEPAPVSERKPPSPKKPDLKKRDQTDEDDYDESEETYLIENTLTNVDFMESAFGGPDEITERYEEMGTIGQGGMGEVLLAKDTQLLRKVAIKVLKDGNPAALSYFLREAQITAQLDHPNIVPLYTVKEPDENTQNVSFVMKLVKGKTFGEIIAKARKIYKQNPKAELEQEINLKSRLDYFLKACEGIAYAHRKQVVHRDLKPANIMIGDFGEVYVMDWGIAKMMKDDADDDLTAVPHTQIFTDDGQVLDQPETQIGGIVGTLSYMSPEQAKGLPDVNTKSDIFSMGAILYELVTLKPARVGNPAQKLQWAQEGYLNTLEHIVPEHQKIPQELKAIIYKATAFSPKDRYPKVSALAEDVRAFLRGDEVSEHPDNIPRKVWRWMSKHREITVIALMAIFLIFSFVTIFSLYRERSAMLASQIREKQLTRLQAEVSSQAHMIDSRFQRLEDLASDLSRSAMYLIQYAPPNEERFYWIWEFRDPAKAPKDYVHAALYDKPVSIEYPVVKLSPGVEAEEVAETMQRLAPLRYHFKQVLLASRGNTAPLPEEEARRLLTIHGVPIRWAYIGLEAGVMYSFPGKETYSDEYDPRRRPWYALGAHKDSVRWGNPYMDNQGQGLVLPCATSLFDSKGQFFGVLGMDVTFSDIIRVNLTRKAKVGVIEESFLLDNKARVVVSSTHISSDTAPTDKSGKLLLSSFHEKEVVDAILRSESGVAEVERDGKRYIYTFYEMPSLGWFYVEEMLSSSIF